MAKIFPIGWAVWVIKKPLQGYELQGLLYVYGVFLQVNVIAVNNLWHGTGCNTDLIREPGIHVLAVPLKWPR